MENIGFRAHDFGSFGSADELGATIERIKSPSFIQLAIGKVLKPSRPWTEWDEDYVSQIRDALAGHGVSTAVVGCYINPVHPDEDERKKHIARFKRSLMLTKAFGCPIVATETGSWSPTISYNVHTWEEEVFSIFLSSLEEMLKAAEDNDAICAIEPVSHQHTICSVERMVRVLETFPSEHLRVVWDPVNLVPINGIAELDGSHPACPCEEAQRAYWTPALDAFGEKICAIHCKDYVLDDAGLKKGDKPVLTGVFNWKALFKDLRERSIEVPVLLENHNPSTLVETLSALNEY